MPWFFPFSSGIKKRSCRYLLQRYLGQFLEEKLTLDQLSVDLYNGTGTVSDLTLDVQALNELGEQQCLPIEFVDGYISEISVSVPWSSLLSESSSLEINGLHLVIQPKQRNDNGMSMFESMWSSMSSSMQLAEECLKQSSPELEEPNPLEGLELFAQTIDSILTRVKLKFINTVIRLEHLPKDGVTGVALEVHIREFSYFDESCTDTSEDNLTKPTVAYSVKVFTLEGIELLSNEFLSSNRTVSRSLLTESISSQVSEDLNKTSNLFDKKCCTDSDVICFGQLHGKQEIRLKIKQKENVSGPKVDFEINLNAFVCLLSPRQLRVVAEVVYGLMSPHLQDNSNVVTKTHYNQKPMTVFDFEKVEQELTHQVSPTNTSYVSKSLQNASGWSSAVLGEESDDDFQPLKGPTCNSLSSSVTNSVSSYSSNTSSYHNCKEYDSVNGQNSSRHRNKYKEKGSSSELDFGSDARTYKVRLSSLAAIVLHEDVLQSDGGTVPTLTSLNVMKSIVNEFFRKFAHSTMYSGSGDFEGIGSALRTCLADRSHFRLHCTTNILSADEKCDPTCTEILCYLSMANAELVEYVTQNDKTEHIELLHFTRHDTLSKINLLNILPDVNVRFKFSNNSKHFSSPSRTELLVTLQNCRTEIDVTILNRLLHVIDNFSKFKNAVSRSSEIAKNCFNDVVTGSSVDNRIEWKISSPNITAKLRFPIPDMKMKFENLRTSSNKRNIYDDNLFIELVEISIQSNSMRNRSCQTYEMLCKSSQISFQEANTVKPVPFIFCGVDEHFGTSPQNEQGFGWPRLVLRFYPQDKYIELEDIEDQFSPGNMAQSYVETKAQEPSPFTAKMIMRESDILHTKTMPNNDAEEIILPGNKQEISEFVEYACHKSLIHLDITLPTLTIQLPSKHFFEVVYNRFSNDLLLWVPECTQSFYDSFNNSTNASSSTMFTSFSMCRSTIKRDSDSDDENNTGVNLMFDHEPPSTTKVKSEVKHQQSKFTICLTATEGVLDIFPHARDSSGKVIPGQFGEIQLMFNDGSLFFVNEHKSEPLLNFLCLQVNHISLYHCCLIPGNIDIVLKPMDRYPSKHVLPTIYRTNREAIINEEALNVGTGDTSDDMLTLAVKLQGQEKRIKNICVANCLCGATIFHRVRPPYTSWLSQLIDFFDVIDYPVPNYQPWKVITQLHQQLLNCVLDYRPLHIPLRAAVTVENFNISSNITSKTSTSILRFIAEEASLFLSREIPNDGNRDPWDVDALSINLKTDYVCVIDMGLFELSLRLTDGGEDGPQTDLRASNNVFHIRTCSDSAMALMELVRYVSCDGDMTEPKATVTKRETKCNENDLLVNLNEEEERVNTNRDVPCMNSDFNGSDDGVRHLVDEAINDTTIRPPRRRRNTNSVGSENVELFYFQGEDTSSHDSSDSHVYTDSQSSEEDIEAEFCVLEREIGSGYSGRNNNPEVRLLTETPILIIDNHFAASVHKIDALNAPKRYPNAVSKYTLREMTIVWHMYGGRDFNVTPAPTPQQAKCVTIAEEDLKDDDDDDDSSDGSESKKLKRHSSVDSVASYSSNSTIHELSSVTFYASRSPRVSISEDGICSTGSPKMLLHKQKEMSWKVQGGKNRKHDVLMEFQLTKLKFQYEIYPKKTKQASRYVLIIQEVEIRDRLASSKINKFLYLYSSPSRPKQSNANMVVIKATNIRPEPNINHLQECCLRVSLLPLRLNIDQDSLLFLITFFSEISGNIKETESSSNTCTSVARTTFEPVLNINESKITESSAAPVNDQNTTQNTPMFIRSFIFAPEVPIRLDYEGKRVDMSHGPLAGIIMGLGQLSCSELKLKRIHNRHGFLGIDKLISHILAEWLQDIKKNQLPSILGGVGPIYSLVQLFQGVRDLFWLPIEQYQKDGRIVRGLQRGANSFTTSTAMAALELTARIVYAIQRIAETAFDIVSPGPSIRYLRCYENNGKGDRKGRLYYKYNQPADIREGVTTALLLVKEGFGETAQTLVRVASLEHEVKGTVGAVGGVLRQIPSTALTPIILASQATSNVLDGVKSQLVPEARAEAVLKWRRDL